MKALVIKADETQELIDLSDAPGAGSAKELQDSVGGYIEAVLMSDGWIMYANEDGLMLNLPFNPKASALVVAVCEANDRPVPFGADRLVGDVVIVGHDGSEDNVPISDEWIHQFKEMDLWVSA